MQAYKHLTLILVAFWASFSFAQTDTLKVDGPNLADLSQYIIYWVDSTQTGKLKQAVKNLESGSFKKWVPATTLNLGTSPYPLWWHLKVQNTGTTTQEFWWSIYTQADSLLVYRFKDSLWQVTDTILYKTHLDDKKIRTRFPVIPLKLGEGESQQLLVKIRNLHHTQNAFTDLTTSAHNLQWEKRFYLKIGFFVGAFLLFAVVCLILHFFMRLKTFLFFSGYLVCVIIMMLHEELLLTVAPSKWLFLLIKDLHPLPLSLVALGLHYMAITFLFNENQHSEKWKKFSGQLNKWIFLFGLVATLICALFTETFSFQNHYFHFIWSLCIALVFVMLLNTFFIVIWLMHLQKKLLLGIVIATTLIYYNAAGYFLNYAGILNYYTITYPNYFYWIVSFEFIVLGSLLAWRYNKTLQININLLKQNARNEELSHLRTISMLEEERRQIARNLHDDLGTTLSAIKLIVSNNYKEDQQLNEMTRRVGEEIRRFYKKVVESGDELASASEQLKLKVIEAEKLSGIKIEFITNQSHQTLNPELKESLLRIATELLSNLVKHSKAKTATVQLLIDDEQLQLIIEDDGVGFNTKKNQQSMGIQNIYSRAERWGGNVYFSSNPKGTICIVNIPLKKSSL